MAVYVYVNCLTAMAAFIPAPFSDLGIDWDMLH